MSLCPMETRLSTEDDVRQGTWGQPSPRDPGLSGQWNLAAGLSSDLAEFFLDYRAVGGTKD